MSPKFKQFGNIPLSKSNGRFTFGTVNGKPEIIATDNLYIQKGTNFSFFVNDLYDRKLSNENFDFISRLDISGCSSHLSGMVSYNHKFNQKWIYREKG